MSPFWRLLQNKKPFLDLSALLLPLWILIVLNLICFRPLLKLTQTKKKEKFRYKERSSFERTYKNCNTKTTKFFVSNRNKRCQDIIQSKHAINSECASSPSITILINEEKRRPATPKLILPHSQKEKLAKHLLESIDG